MLWHDESIFDTNPIPFRSMGGRHAHCPPPLPQIQQSGTYFGWANACKMPCIDLFFFLFFRQSEDQTNENPIKWHRITHTTPPKQITRATLGLAISKTIIIPFVCWEEKWCLLPIIAIGTINPCNFHNLLEFRKKNRIRHSEDFLKIKKKN